MALTEDQILRYSRQILLRGVGGIGQERLLASGARVDGEGPALRSAAAYLAAGGTPICLGEMPAKGGPLGFPLPGETQATWLVMPRPDPEKEGPWLGAIAEWPQPPVAAEVQVVLGRIGLDAQVIYRGSAGCRQCFSATLARLEGSVSEAQAVTVGALAALIFQRLVLGWSESIGRLCVRASGSMLHETTTSCALCRSARE